MARAVPVLLVVALLSAGCATGGSTSLPANVAAEIPGIADRECRYTAPPGDVATWRGGAADAEWWTAGAAGVPQPVTLSVRYGAAGNLDWVREIGAGTPAGERLARRVAASLRESSPPAGSGVRLRFEPEQAASVLPGVACDAALPEDETFLTPGYYRVDFSQIPPASRRFYFDVEVDVGPDGQPREARLTRKSSGIASIEGQILEAARRHRYLPALLDGFPVGGEFRYEFKARSRTSASRGGL